MTEMPGAKLISQHGRLTKAPKVLNQQRACKQVGLANLDEMIPFCNCEIALNSTKK